jgi:lipoprotein NlpI
MMLQFINSIPQVQAKVLCEQVKALISAKKYSQCEDLIASYMGKYPHACQPHNLMGILLEEEGNHTIAMEHFRVAWMFDPSYLPAQQNLTSCSDSFAKQKKYYYEKKDCPAETTSDYVLAYDQNNVGHIVKGWLA